MSSDFYQDDENKGFLNSIVYKFAVDYNRIKTENVINFDNPFMRKYCMNQI